MAENLATAYVQIIPSAKGISGSISSALGDESVSAGKSAGQKIGSNIVSTLKKVIIAAGIGKFFKSVFEEGAALQQSIGGIETLYTAADGSDEAVKSLQEYAKSAASAGISANTYMEQAVSFGASLKQSLGGDVVKAAKAADTAILDMADNSAKMGTSIDSIQMAYQGFAKQNYTMLDNLKIGYGGTKEEMARLLKDATALSGVEYDISNLSDVYSAIHVIQESLGITGVAAEEAGTTFSGSFGAMKAAADNLFGAMALGGDITPQLEDFKQKVLTFVQGNLIPMLTQIVQNLPTLLAGLVDIVTPLIPTLIQGAVEILTILATAFINALPDIIPMIVQLGVSIGEALMSVDWGAIASQVMTALGTAFQENPQAVIGAFGILAVLLGSKLAGGLAPFIGKIGSGIGSMVSGLFGKIGGAASSAAGPISTAGSSMGSFSQNALGLVAAGAGIALAAAGLWLLSQAAISIANGGPGAAIAMIALTGALVGMAIGAAALAPALTAGAVGLIAFGAGVLMVGAGVFLATAGLSLLATQLPTIAQYGGAAAMAIVQLSVGLLAFAVGAIAGGAGALLLTAGAAAAAAGILLFTVAIIAASAGALLLAVGLLGVQASMSSIAGSARSASNNLVKMVTSIDVVSAGLDGIKDAAGSVIDALIGFFTNGTGKLQTATTNLTATLLPFSTALTALAAVCSSTGASISTIAGVLNACGLSAMQFGAGTAIAAASMSKISASTSQLSAGLMSLSAMITVSVASFAMLGSSVASGMKKMGSSAKSGVNGLKTAFSAIPVAIGAQMLLAINVINRSIVQMQRIFANTKFEFSRNIALPHFRMSGSFNAQSGQVPSVGVDWYAKGGILTKPTIFGMSGGRLLGGGEAGPEAVAPISTLKDYLRDVTEESGGDVTYTQNITINSPTALTPSEVARQTRNATRSMVLALKGKGRR